MMAAQQPAVEAPTGQDLLGALFSIEAGVYAITALSRDAFGDGVEADTARLGIHYVALKLEADLRAIVGPLAEAEPA